MPRKKAATAKTANRARKSVEIAGTDPGTESESALPRNKKSTKTNTMKKKKSTNSRSKRPVPSTSKDQQRRTARLEANGLKPNQKTLTQIGFVPSPAISFEDHDLDYISETEETQQPREEKIAPAPRGRKRKAGDRAGSKKTVGFVDDITLTQMYQPSEIGTATSRSGRKQADTPTSGLRRSTRTKKPPCALETINEETEPESDYERKKRVRKSRAASRRLDGSNTPTIDLTADDGDADAVVGRSIDKPTLTGPQKSFEVPETQWGKLTNPMTPQKLLKSVIPSSQSPETPEIAFRYQNSPSSSSRSPLRPISSNPVSKIATSTSDLRNSKALYPPSPLSGNRAPLNRPSAAQMERAGAYDNHELGGHRPLPEKPSSSWPRPLDIRKDDAQKSPVVNESSQANVILESQKRAERVVNDTEDESADEDGFYDAFSQLSDAEIHLPEQHSQNSARQAQTVSESSDVNHNTESLPHTSNYLDQSDDIPQSTLNSELSMLYYRKPMSYHWNADDIPDLSSTGLAELFATQGDAHPQNNLHGGEDPETTLELVPESSPAKPGGGDSHETNDPPSSPIILVQSSQTPSVACDFDNNDQLDEDDKQESSSRRGLLTESQLLTDSLMESMPNPPGWASSQMSALQEEDEIPYPSNR